MTKRTPEKVARLRELASTETASSIARALGVSPACVGNWAAEDGIKLLTRAQAMKKLHADPEFAAQRDARASERMKKLNADPEFAARASERMKKLHADPEFAASLRAALKGAKGIKVPHWVPECLHDEFLETAATVGEIDAARHVRRLKAAMVEGVHA